MTPPDLARSIGHRIRNSAADRGVEAGRLRRHIVFQRILARLAPTEQWVLKGGYCLEVRLDLHARATQDLDIALLASDAVRTSLDVQDLLFSALEPDPQGDGFTFEVELPRPMSADELGKPGWRVTVRASIAGAHFEVVKLDVVARPQEIDGGTEILVVDPVLLDLGHEPVVMWAVGVAQHAAEKAHAYARVYAHERPSSRVKDLVDLVLLAETDLLDTAAWGARLRHVFEVRDGAGPPETLPQPPASWTDPYAVMAVELSIGATDISQAWALVNAVYRAAVRTSPSEERTR